MKKRFSLIFVVIVITFLSTNLFSQSLPNFLIMTENWKPYNFEEGGVLKGVSTDLLVLMLKRTGSKQGRKDIKLYPWSRSYKLVQEKENAVLFTTTRTPAREKMFKWVGPIFDMTFYFHALKSKNIKIKSFNDLKKYKIGVIRDDVTEQLTIKKGGIAQSDLQRVTSSSSNIKKLEIGRIDLTPQSIDGFINSCKKMGIDPNKFETVFVLDSKKMYYAFNTKTSDSIIKRFQKAFDDLNKSGDLKKIKKKYGK